MFVFVSCLDGKKFRITKWTDHTCTTEVGLFTLKPGADATQEAKYSCFNQSAFLAPALAPVLKGVAHTKLNVKTAKSMLANYMVVAPEHAFVRSVIALAKNKSKEISEMERATHMKHYCELLRQYGHHAKMCVTDFEGMKQVCLD